MKFTPTWYKQDVADIPSFQELEDITGSAYDEQGVYIGPKEKPDMQLVMDRRTNRQYWAPKEYDEDAIKYSTARMEQNFNSQEWWGMVRDPHLTFGQKISTAYIEGLKQAGKLVANAPTKIVAAATGLTDAVGIDAGNLAKAAFINNPTNLPIYLASSLARKGVKATAEDYLQLLKDIKTPSGKMGETASLYRASAQNWQSTLDKYLPDVDENIKAHSTLVAIGSMAGQVGGSLLLAAATSHVGGMAAVAGVFGSQQFYDIREEYLSKGYSLDSANIYAGLAAIAEGGLEALGFTKWLKYATLKPSLRNHLIAGFMEASQEALQTTAEETITNLSGVREETLTEILAQIAISAVAGFIPGAGLSVVSGGVGIRQEKAAYELDNAVENTANIVPQKQQTKPQPKEGSVIKGTTPKQELELAKANKGSNQLYEVVKNIADSYGVTDEKVIDGLYYFARNQAVQGKVGEELLEGLGNQLVAYKNQLSATDKKADKENKEAAADIAYHLSQEAADKFHSTNVKAMEESGIEKQKAEVAASQLDIIYKNLSEKLGIDLQQFKQVIVRALPQRKNVQEEIADYDGEVPFQTGKGGEKEIAAIKQQIDQLDKLSRSKPKTTLLSTLRKTGVDYKNTNLDPQVLKDLRIKNVPVSKGGLGAEASDYLIRHGFMQDFAQGETVSYEMTAERNDQANEMLERAIGGENVYRIDDMEKMAQAQQAETYKAQLQAELDEKVDQEGKRGYISLGDTINEIVLGRNSDISTLQHEMMHHFRNVINLMAAKGNKEAIALKAQMDKIIEAHKDEVKQGINKEEEVLSEAYEAWLYGGVVSEDPTQQKLFDALKQFFNDVYDSVKAITGIRIDPEIDMFFRQLTGEMPIQMREEAASPSGKYDYKVTKGEKYGFTQEQREHIAKEVIDNMEGSLFSRFKVKDVKGEQPLGGYWKSRQTWWTDEKGKKTKEPEKAGEKYQSNAQEVIKINIPDSKSVLTVHKDPLAIRAMFKDLGISITPKPEYANDIYYQFAGPKAKTAASDKLEQAVKMDAEGESKRDIRNKTGWFKGADEKWRFEIKDGEINEDAVLEKNEIGETEDHGFLYYYTVKLGDLYKAPELYEAYPDLKDITVSFQDLDPEQYGSYHRGNSFFDESISLSSKYLTKDNPDFIKKIDKIKATKEYKKYDEAFTRKVEDGDYAKANKMQDEAMEEFYNTPVGKEYKELMWGKNPPVRREIEGLSKKAKKALIHEIQHAIQQREGFSNGASPKSFMDLKMRAEITQQIMDRKKEVVKQEFIKELENKAGDKKLVRELIAEEKKANEVDRLYIESKITREEAVRGEARFKELLSKVGITGAEYYQMRRNLEIKNGLDYWRQDAPYSPYDLYKMVAGEVEARNVEARADMTDEERVKSFPEDTQDIKNADVLVVFEDGTELAYRHQEDAKDLRDMRVLYQTIKAEHTGSKAADPKPSKERIAKDLQVIRNKGVEKYEPKSKLGRSLGDWGKHILLTVRQRAGAIDPKIKAFFDKLDYFQPNLEKKFASKANGFIKKFQGLTEVEKDEFDYYIYNQCHEELNAFLKEKGMEKEYNEVRQLLNFIYAVSNQAGIDMNFVNEYFPTSMIDYAGFLDYLKGTDKWSYIQKALREADPEGVWSDKEKAEAINKLLRGYRMDPVSKPKNAKERTILYKSPELMKFYEHSDVALIKYLQGMSQAIAINKAFGKGGGFDTDETIGAVVLDLINSGTITNKEEAEIKRLLKSRLSYGATPEFIAMVKNVGYLQTMNNITSAVTQLGDLYAPFYKYSFGTAIKSIFGKAEITKTDLGLDKIWEEFSDSSKTGIAVDKLFKVIGLEKMDSFGKNVAINASLLNLREQAAKGNIELTNRLAYTFGKDAQKVLADIKAGKVTEEVKILIWADLADTQPIGRSGVPTGYLDNPHGRLFYQLKTFSLNQISLFYADSLVNIQKGIKYKNKAQFLKGVQNGFKLLLLLTAGNAGADVLKNLIMGRDIDISDTVVSNLLWNIGVSKYTFYKGKRDGYARALLSSYLMPPQLSAADDMLIDVRNIAGGKKQLKDSAAVTYLPYGRAYYWWFGGGSKQGKERTAKMKKKAAAENRKKKKPERKKKK